MADDVTGSQARARLLVDGAAGASGTAHVAVLDRGGVIVAVNEAWVDFGLRNGATHPAACGVGASYLAACDGAQDAGSAIVGAAIRRAVAGQLAAPISLDLPCNGPDELRTFTTTVSSRFGDDGACLGATVVLVPVAPTAPPQGPDAAAPDLRTPGPLADADRPVELRVSPETLAALVDGFPGGVLVSDDEGRVETVSARLEELSGYRAEELVGQPVEVLVPEPVRLSHRVFQEGFRSRPRTRFMAEGSMLTLRRKDGTALPVEIVMRPVRLDDRLLVLAGVRDVSARREAEAQGRLVTQALDAISDGVVVLDAATGIRRYANRATLERAGRSLEELSAVPVGSPSTAEEEARIRSAIHAVVTGTAPEASVETHVVRRDRPPLPVEMRITHAPPAPGEAGLGSVMMVAFDISERLAAQARLRDSEASFRTMFEQAPVAAAVVALCDEGRDRRVVLANSALAALLGEPVEDLLGRNLADYAPHGSSSDRLDIARKLIRAPQKRFSRTVTFRRADGRIIWVDVTATRIDLPGITDPTVLAFLTDVTARQQAERERHRRADATRLVSEITTAILAGAHPRQTFQPVVAGAAALLEADDAVLAVIGPDGRRRALAAVGSLGSALLRGDLPIADETVDWFTHWSAGRPDEGVALPDPPPYLPPDRADLLGPAAVTWIWVEPEGRGLLYVSRAKGKPRFTAEDVELLTNLARQLSLAGQLGAARIDRERLSLLEERERIARDLHDTVIQDVISVGLQLVQGLGGELDPDRRTNRREVVAQLDQTVRRLRATVEDLSDASAPLRLGEMVESIVAAASRAAGFPVTLHVTGVLEFLSPSVAEHVLAVLHEGLANVVRHSRATRAGVAIDVDVDVHEVTVVLEDDGRGVPDDPSLGRGLGNLDERARILGGRFTRESGRPVGTRLAWSVPLDPPPP